MRPAPPFRKDLLSFMIAKSEKPTGQQAKGTSKQSRTRTTDGQASLSRIMKMLISITSAKPTIFDMPYKSEKAPIEGTKYDRRVKLSKEDKEEILALYESGNHSQRELARMYGVSRRSIQFIVNPEKLQENKQRRAERGGWKAYYDKEKNTAAIREHRNYKQSLYVKGLITPDHDNNDPKD